MTFTFSTVHRKSLFKSFLRKRLILMKCRSETFLTMHFWAGMKDCRKIGRNISVTTSTSTEILRSVLWPKSSLFGVRINTFLLNIAERLHRISVRSLCFLNYNDCFWYEQLVYEVAKSIRSCERQHSRLLMWNRSGVLPWSHRKTALS